MKFTRYLPALCLGLVVVFTNTLANSIIDTEREQLIAKRLSERVIHGDVVTLKSNGTDVFGLYAIRSTAKRKGAVVLLHPMAAHPDWPGVVNYLREGLPKYGWSTLSIQLPIISPEEPIEEYGMTFEEANARINAAVEHLKSLDYQHIVLVGYGFGAATGAHLLAENNPGVLGLVGISMLAQPYLIPKFSLTEQLEKLTLPVLDIYGSQDREVIIDSAPDRRLAARKAENPYYKQLTIGGADHEYRDQELILLKRMMSWLNELIAKMTLSKDNIATTALIN